MTNFRSGLIASFFLLLFPTLMAGIAHTGSMKPVPQGNVYRIDYTVNADKALAYTVVIEQDLKDQSDVREWRQYSWDFDPETQTLAFEEAWVDLPGKQRIVLGDSDVRVGSISDNEYSGIFSALKRKTLIFP